LLSDGQELTTAPLAAGGCVFRRLADHQWRSRLDWTREGQSA